MLPALSRHSGRRKAAATRAKARCGPVSDGICCPASTRPSGASEPRWRRRLLRNFRELKLSGREDLNLRPFGPELTVAASQPGARRLADDARQPNRFRRRASSAGPSGRAAAPRSA